MSTTSDRTPNGYAELFAWLLHVGKKGARGLYLCVRGTDYQSLADFSRNFSVCMKSVADVEKGLELCIRPIRRTRIGRCWATAVETVQQGGTLTEALSPARESLPGFYLPLVQAGEQSGRLAEIFQFLHDHCKALCEPLTNLRRTWLFPLAIFFAGSVLRILLCLLSGNLIEAIQLTFSETLGWALTALILGLVMLSPIRYSIDKIRLSLPFVGTLEREIAMHRFFRVMSMMYAVGEHRVESMIRLAAETVTNHAARTELEKAAIAIENHQTMAEAFQKVWFLSAQTQTTITTAEHSGTLERGFQQISDEAGTSMVMKLRWIQPILFRLVILMVAISILSTLLKVALGLI